MPDEQPKTKPFHQSIVDAIKRCKNEEEFSLILQIIEETDIPNNHDKILNAIDDFSNSHDKTKLAGKIVSVTTSILAQKEYYESAPERTQKILQEIIMKL
ncbi:MAG: hypothetical protein WCP91_04100 [Candidatus Berkelbacteria bacterium]